MTHADLPAIGVDDTSFGVCMGRSFEPSNQMGIYMDKSLRILIVDDHARAREGLSAFLSTQEGLQVVCEAFNGEDALAKIERQNPNLILMDIHMPVMDGLKATRIIKARWPQIKVIILTIYADYGVQAQAAGADAFLVKGCSMEEMTATIQSVC